jgi:hypothetical protein
MGLSASSALTPRGQERKVTIATMRPDVMPWGGLETSNKQFRARCGHQRRESNVASTAQPQRLTSYIARRASIAAFSRPPRLLQSRLGLLGGYSNGLRWLDRRVCPVAPEQEMLRCSPARCRPVPLMRPVRAACARSSSVSISLIHPPRRIIANKLRPGKVLKSCARLHAFSCAVCSGTCQSVGPGRNHSLREPELSGNHPN